MEVKLDWQLDFADLVYATEFFFGSALLLERCNALMLLVQQLSLLFLQQLRLLFLRVLGPLSLCVDLRLVRTNTKLEKSSRKALR